MVITLENGEATIAWSSRTVLMLQFHT